MAQNHSSLLILNQSVELFDRLPIGAVTALARIVEGGIPTEELIAQVLVSKYTDHLPLYR